MDCEAFVAATLTPSERVFGNLAAFVHDNSSESQHFGSNFEDSYSKLMGESYEKEVEWDWVKEIVSIGPYLKGCLVHKHFIFT